VAHPKQHNEAANAKWKYEVFIGKQCNRNSLAASALPEDDPVGSKHVTPIVIVILMF
jgi:hypothetical protein